MKIEIHHSNETRCDAMAPQLFNPPFPPLEHVTKPNLTTDEAAYYLNRKPQTLRGWACHEDGPIRPKRTNGRLDWSTSETKIVARVLKK